MIARKNVRRAVPDAPEDSAGFFRVPEVRAPTVCHLCASAGRGQEPLSMAATPRAGDHRRRFQYAGRRWPCITEITRTNVSPSTIA